MLDGKSDMEKEKKKHQHKKDVETKVRIGCKFKLGNQDRPY